AELAVGDRLEADRLLLLDDRFDFAVRDRGKRRRIDLAAGEAGARLFQRRRAQQAADVIGAERRTGGHGAHGRLYILRAATLSSSVIRPCSSAAGRGGQPGMWRSTGSTLSTPPSTA